MVPLAPSAAAMIDRGALNQSTGENRIARQREIVATAFKRGQDTVLATSMLRAFEKEESLRAFKAHRQRVIDRYDTKSGK
jgi:hypothetical protein